jgi:hypothetical protein
VGAAYVGSKVTNVVDGVLTVEPADRAGKLKVTVLLVLITPPDSVTPGVVLKLSRVTPVGRGTVSVVAGAASGPLLTTW